MFSSRHYCCSKLLIQSKKGFTLAQRWKELDDLNEFKCIYFVPVSQSFTSNDTSPFLSSSMSLRCFKVFNAESLTIMFSFFILWELIGPLKRPELILRSNVLENTFLGINHIVVFSYSTLLVMFGLKGNVFAQIWPDKPVLIGEVLG